MTVTTYHTKYGDVYHSTVCKDDYKNFVTRGVYIGPKGMPHGRPVALTLQQPAYKSIRAVEKAIKKQVVVTGSNRTCALQAHLYASDSHRYASPNVTLHTQGLAIDVSMNYLTEKMRRALLAEGWHQSRPDDEPWHFSYRLTA